MPAGAVGGAGIDAIGTAIGRLRRSRDRCRFSDRLGLAAGGTELSAGPIERSTAMDARSRQFHKLLCYNKAPSHVDSSIRIFFL